ncbi:hypothetical protein IAT40_003951 [Kwoniella sp. CBS 6097]
MIHSIESGIVLPLLRRSRPATTAARQAIKSIRGNEKSTPTQTPREFSSTAQRSSSNSEHDSSSPSTSTSAPAQSESETTAKPTTVGTKPLRATDAGYEHQSSWVNSIVSTARADLRNDHAARLPSPGSSSPSSSSSAAPDSGLGAAQGQGQAVGVSRDMSGSAESSKSSNTSTNRNHTASGRSNNLSEEDREYAELFDTLREKWAKPASTSTSSSSSTSHQPSPPQSISSRLSFAPFATPSPRRGVHARQRRAAGQTPKEAETFDAILAGIFANLESSSTASSSSSSSSRNRAAHGPGGSGGGGGGVVSDPYAAARGGGFGLGRGAGVGDRARNLRRWFERDEVDDEVVEELEMLKEEMAVIADDVELVEWAKNRVFKPLPPVDVISTTTTTTTTKSTSDPTDTTKSSVGGSTATPPSTFSAAPLLTFPPTYPKILAHVLRTLRVNYNSPHLVLSLFQYAQTSSLESYLSGCLTGAYNEVLTVKWESFRDFVGVENGIREMEVMGVNWDAATARLVSRIVEEVSKDLLPSLDGMAGGRGLGIAGLDFSDNADVDANSDNISKGGFKNLSTMMGGASASVGVGCSSPNSNFNWKYGGLTTMTTRTSTLGGGGVRATGANDVLERLGRLEKKVQKDVKAQEKMYENMQRKKRRAREERERRLEKESQQGAYEGGGVGVGVGVEGVVA